jgi:outer membrane protein OmpA-like peptidoglycan-associated protein
MIQPPRPLRCAAALLLGGMLATSTLSAPALARTILDRKALDALTASGLPLPPPKPPGPPAPEAPAYPAAAPPPAARGHAPSPPGPPTGPAPQPGPGPVPPVPAIPPPIVVPVRPAPPPGPPQIAADATGTATQFTISPKSGPHETGLRLTFGPGADKLNQASAAALRDFASAAPAGATFTVNAFAAGTPDDPSTPRRLSLSRALAVRGILLGAGVASARILVRSLGASMPALAAGPPDRVDVTIPAPAK